MIGNQKDQNTQPILKSRKTCKIYSDWSGREGKILGSRKGN
jgi:hypothetical protein